MLQLRWRSAPAACSASAPLSLHDSGRQRSATTPHSGATRDHACAPAPLAALPPGRPRPAGDGQRRRDRAFGIECAAVVGSQQHGSSGHAQSSLPPLPSRRSVTSMRQLLQVVRGMPPEQLDHAMLGRVCATVLRLLARQSRAAVVLRRDARRALLDLSVFKGMTPASGGPVLPPPPPASTSILSQVRPGAPLASAQQQQQQQQPADVAARRRRPPQRHPSRSDQPSSSSAAADEWRADGTPWAREEAAAAGAEVLRLALQRVRPPWHTCADPLFLAYLVQAAAQVQAWLPPPAPTSSAPGGSGRARRGAAAAAAPLLPTGLLDQALEGLLPLLRAEGAAGVPDGCLGRLLWGLGALGHRPSDAWLQVRGCWGAGAAWFRALRPAFTHGPDASTRGRRRPPLSAAARAASAWASGRRCACCLGWRPCRTHRLPHHTPPPQPPPPHHHHPQSRSRGRSKTTRGVPALRRRRPGWWPTC